jgi:hypothetical protein
VSLRLVLQLLHDRRVEVWIARRDELVVVDALSGIYVLVHEGEQPATEFQAARGEIEVHDVRPQS